MSTQFLTTRYVKFKAAKTFVSKFFRTSSTGISEIGPSLADAGVIQNVKLPFERVRDIISVEQVELLDS
jgi:hypothetical protein